MCKYFKITSLIALFCMGQLTYAQNNQKIESVNGTKFETVKKASSDAKVSMSGETKTNVMPDKKASKSEVVRKNGKTYIANPEKLEKPQATAIKRDKDLKYVKLNPTLTVRETGKDGDAKISFKVIGDPFAEWGYVDMGFHMILDPDRELFDNFWDPFWDTTDDIWEGWYELYDNCE
jgi:hypothetical protein